MAPPISADANKTRALEEAYRQHSNNFRTWLIAFGIGVPAFLSTSDKAWAAFLAAPNARWFCLSAKIAETNNDNSAKSKIGDWWLRNDWPKRHQSLIN